MNRASGRYRFSCRKEPAYQEIKDFWRPVINPIAFPSWPDHVFKFTLLWNGSILAVVGKRSPWCRDHLNSAADQEMHLSVGLGYQPHFPAWSQWEGGDWPCLAKSDLPVYTRAHRLEGGGEVTQEVFSFCPAGRLKRGDETMVAWMRFEVRKAPPKQAFLWLQVSRGST